MESQNEQEQSLSTSNGAQNSEPVGPQIVQPTIPQQPPVAPVQTDVVPPAAITPTQNGSVQAVPTNSPVFQAQQQPGQVNAQNLGSMPAKNNKRLLIILGVVAAVIILATTVYLVTKSSKKTDLSNSYSASGSSDITTLPDEEIESTPQKQTEIAVNKSVEADLGVKVNLSKVVRNFPQSYSKAGKEIVLAEVEFESNDKYSIVVSKSAFMIVADGIENRITYTIDDEDISAAGFVPMQTDSAKKGSPVKGYIPFEISAGSKQLIFRYHRAETKIILGNGEILPARDFDIVISE